MKAFKALILLGLAGMHKIKLRAYTFVFGGCVLKISLHYGHSLTALRNFRAGIEYSARRCVLRGCILKTAPHIRQGVRWLGIPGRESNTQPVVAFYEAVY